ncbi:MAG: menaquinone-dependent protoporphyrinogen IX dehydrogenase [Vibrio sp.]
MKKNIILYSTCEGQAHKIALHIAQELGAESCELVDLQKNKSVDLTQYDRVILGASIRYGSFNKALYKFIDQHLQQLQQANAYFYGVNLTARKEGKDTPEGSAYLRKFMKKSPWQPKEIGVFAGALLYPRYNWFDRTMIKFIMSMTGGETDTTKEVEYTNWEKVTQFAQMIAKS